MWRTLVCSMLAALVGAALATLIYVFVLSLVEVGRIPFSLEDARIALAVLLVASWFTIPGALLLAAVEGLLNDRLHSESRLNCAIVASGALTGAAMLGVFGLRTDGAVEAAALGGFYGSITAIVFVVFQRRLGSRQRQS